MKIGITHRLFWAFLATAGMAAAIMVIVMQWSIRRGFIRYVNSVEKAGASRLAMKLTDEYRREGSWQFLQRNPARWPQLIESSLPGGDSSAANGTRSADAGRESRFHRRFPRHLAHRFATRLYLLDAGHRLVVGQRDPVAPGDVTPLTVDGRTMGYLGIEPRTHLAGAHQRRFIREQGDAFLVVALLLVCLAAGLALPLARRMVRPLRELAEASRSLAAGEFSTRVSVTSRDELGELAGTFNTLALTLEKNEESRRQWVADISHELRTPLAVLRGEIEALQDGVRQATPESIHSLHNEVLRLGRLVDDLHQLAMTDLGALTYRKQVLDVARILAAAVEGARLAAAAGTCAVAVDLPKKGTARVVGDPERLHQLFANLLDNSLKYTDGDGRLQVSMKVDDEKVLVDFQDSAPGVPDEALPRLFERLYRVDGSRNRATGGAGLGLSICRNIVDAHGGSIAARHSPLGGLWIRIELPLAEGK